MPDLTVLDFRSKSVFGSLKFLMPLFAVVFLIGYSIDWQSSAKTGGNAPRLSSASCGDGWDNRFANGANGEVLAIAVGANGNIYVGGGFTQIGGVAANHVARWDGLNWSALGGGTDDYVSSLAVSGGDVYAGGFFGTAGGVPANHIARWNGSAWSALGGGTDGDIHALAISGNNLYVGGEFFAAGGASDTRRIARWDGANWSALGGGASDTVYAIAASGNDIYASGFFTSASQVSANRIAKWNGSAWSALDGGTNNALVALAAAGGNIYAGGLFTAAGCRASGRIARYFLQSFSGNANNDWHNSANWNNGALPDGNSDVNISQADVSISTADAMIRDLRVDENRTLTIAANRTLVVGGSLNLVGSVTGAGTLVVTNCSPSAISREAGAGYIRLSLTRCVNNSGTFDFPVGTANGYTTVQLSNVAGAGSFTVKANQGAYSEAASGLSANRLQRFWNLTNGGIARADVQFNYLPGDVLGTEGNYKIFRINGVTAHNISGTVNPANHTAMATGVESFSPWTLGEQLSPTSATVSIGGRISSQTGRGIFGAQIILIKSNGEMSYARTNPFGFYNFNAVAVGQTYTVNVAHKNYTFLSRVVTVTEDLDGLDFTANPRWQ